jgi:hypothetical protein
MQIIRGLRRLSCDYLRVCQLVCLLGFNISLDSLAFPVTTRTGIVGLACKFSVMRRMYYPDSLFTEHQ